MSFWSGIGNFLGGLFKPGQSKVPPTFSTPAQAGIPQFLPDGSINPMWQWLTTGQVPFSDLPTTTRSSQSGASSTLTDMLTKNFSNTTTKPKYFYGGEDVLGDIRKDLLTRLETPDKVGVGEQMGVINSILGDSEAVAKGARNRLSASGAAGGPQEAGVEEALSRGNLSSIAAFRTAIPSIERARGIEDVNLAGNLLQGLFKGSETTTTGQSRTTGTQNTDWNSIAESIVQGPPRFDPSGLGFLKNDTITTPSTFSQIAQLLALLFGSGAGSKAAGTPIRLQPGYDPGSYLGPSGY